MLSLGYITEHIKCKKPLTRRDIFFTNRYDVLQHVRLPFTKPAFLVGTVGTDRLIRTNEKCRDLVDEAKVSGVTRGKFKNVLL